ncbi:MAG: long-chain-fatty-acid--CoA ligase [Blastocatellia bacterium]|nr:long-chain-fatty-acid--CoA ligase [Blastocatellia bacterium]
MTIFGDLNNCGELLTRNARKYGRETGIVDGDTRLTWQALNERANRFVSGLQTLGVKFGERVCFLSKNCHQFVEALFGLGKIGVAPVMVNYRLAEPEVEYIVRNSGASVILVGAEYAPLATSIARRVEHLRLVVVLGNVQTAEPKLVAYEQISGLGNPAEPRPDRPVETDDLALLLYTSGTTGFPKGAIYSHHSLLVGMFVHVHAIDSRYGRRVMLPSPLYSAAGIAGIYCSVYVGSLSVLINFEPQLALETLVRERITFTNLVPTTIHMLCQREDIREYDFSHLEVLLYGGAPMPEPVLRRAAEIFGCDFRQTFAATETGCAGTVLEPFEHRLALTDPVWAGRLASCGRPQCNVDVRVVNEQGMDVKPGEIGEIIVKTEANMLGYWNNPEATAETIRDGYVYMADMATVDDEGFIFLVDRKKDLIISGALNIYPSEVERILAQHPGVAECAVIGVPHEKWGEAVKAVVVLKSGMTVTETELIAFCEGKIAGFKKPKSVDLVERLPRNPTGKVLRRVLREPYWTSHVNNNT